MSKALVIQNVSFSANKLTTVEFENNVPCTGITLSVNSASFDGIADVINITPTLTPTNTSDAITWESSDTNVATVENGVVTCTGIGSAIITATCGEFSATCSVSYAGETYIKNDGTAYIQTDITETSDMLNFEAVASNDVAVADYTSDISGNGHLFSSANIRYPFVKCTSSKFSLVGHYKGTGATENTVSNYVAGTFYKMVGTSDGTNYDVTCSSEDGNTIYRNNQTAIGSTYDATKTFCICGYGDEPTVQRYMLNGKVKYIKLMSGTTPIHNFVAAKKIVSGSAVYGLFDMVSKTFYGSNGSPFTGAA